MRKHTNPRPKIRKECGKCYTNTKFITLKVYRRERWERRNVGDQWKNKHWEKQGKMLGKMVR